MPAPLDPETTRRDPESHFGWRTANSRFYQCPMCGSWVDSTDPIQVARHEDSPDALMPAKAS